MNSIILQSRAAHGSIQAITSRTQPLITRYITSQFHKCINITRQHKNALNRFHVSPIKLQFPFVYLQFSFPLINHDLVNQSNSRRIKITRITPKMYITTVGNLYLEHCPKIVNCEQYKFKFRSAIFYFSSFRDSSTKRCAMFYLRFISCGIDTICISQIKILV